MRDFTYSGTPLGLLEYGESLEIEPAKDGGGRAADLFPSPVRRPQAVGWTF